MEHGQRSMDWDGLLAELGLRAAPRPTRFVAFHQLVDACGQPGCPVCRCLRELAVRALDGLLYEQVTDPETRARLERSWGFCNWHAWLTREVSHAGLGVAIVYEGLLARIRERLEGTRRELTAAAASAGSAWRRLWRRARSGGFVRARTERAPCPACLMLGRAEAGYLRVVLDAIEEPDFARAYAGSAGVCLPHLTLALARFPRHAGRARLLERTARTLDDLARDLRAFVDRHDYRARGPFTDAEAAACTRVLGFVVGQPELFGHEIPRAPEPGPAAAPPPAPVASPRPHPEAGPAETAELEGQLRELHRQLGDEASRAAAFQYRLRIVEEDRKVLEMNLAGERANAGTWEGLVRELRAEVAELRRRLGLPDPPPPAGG